MVLLKGIEQGSLSQAFLGLWLVEGSQPWYKLHGPFWSCCVCDTLEVIRLRLITPREYHIHHSFIGVYTYYISKLFLANDWWKAVNCDTSYIDLSEAVVYVIPSRLHGSVSHTPQLPWVACITACNITMHLPRFKLQVNLAKKWQSGKQNKTLTCPAQQMIFWAESSQCDSPLFNRVAGQVEAGHY